MKGVFAIIAASLTLVGMARARGPYRMPENYRDWLEWTPPQDRRPFLIRLFSRPSMWVEVGAKKGKVRVGEDGITGAIRSKDEDPIIPRDLIPSSFGVGIKFETEL